MKNAFYYSLKALFVLKTFKFLSRVFGHVEKTARLERQGQFQNPWRHNLANKQLQYTYCNQAMKFRQLTEYNMRKNFVEKSYTKCAAETIPRPLSKKLNQYLWINSVKF